MSKPIADTRAWAAGLTDRERRFVEEYLVDLNARQAAIRARLGKTPKSASEIASRMRRKQTVAAAISALLSERTGATGSRIIEEWGKLAFSDITDVVRVENGQVVISDTSKLTPDQRACIAEISETVGEGGRTIRVKFHDKLGALDRLARSLGMFKERVEVSGPDGGPIEVVDPMERINARLEMLARAQRADSLAEIQPPPRRLPAMTPALNGKIVDTR